MIIDAGPAQGFPWNRDQPLASYRAMPTIRDPEEAVRARYAAAARAPEAALCCPTAYDPSLLAVVPPGILEIDYGCGDPTRWLRAGETVLDLGSGSGKICFMAAKVVGPAGRVIGVDSSEPMLAVARGAAPEAARLVGYANVEFRRGRIQDLAHAEPPVGDSSIDVVISNCVLNLVRDDEKPALFAEIARVLKPGGRAVISDIVASRDVPGHLKADPDLWSGCVSGALREDRFLAAFEAAGLAGVEVLERRDEPWRVVDGIEFRSVTVAAYRPPVGPRLKPSACCAPRPGGACC